MFRYLVLAGALLLGAVALSPSKAAAAPLAPSFAAAAERYAGEGLTQVHYRWSRHRHHRRWHQRRYSRYWTWRHQPRRHFHYRAYPYGLYFRWGR